MTADRWKRLERLFSGAIDRPQASRAAWIEAACGGDPALRRDLDALLRAHDTAGNFLEQPASLDLDDDLAIAGGEPRPIAEAAASDARTALPPGARVGPYAIVDEIGRGGMGIVYLARDDRLGRLVALKALPRAAAGRTDLRERLRREARAAATIAHPAVAVVYALEEIGDEIFIASEYVRGRTLRSRIDEGPVPPGRALAIARAVGEALQAAHGAGVVHRDLKPENVIIGEQGSVKVVDFGIAHLETGDGRRLTRGGEVPGTPAYMAPEQLLGAGVDARTDLYALGVLLAEMVTGRHPMSPSPAADPLPPDIAGIVEGCLQPAPDARYQSARELLNAIDAAQTPARGADGRAAGRPAGGRTPRWWWEFHQAAAAITYWLMVIPAWTARGLIGGTAGRAFFLLVLAAVIVSANLRLHFWFTSRSYAAELQWVRTRSRRWIRAGDCVFAVALTTGGLLLDDRWSAIGVLLISVGIGAAVAFLWIEPTTARAAFGRERGTESS